MKKETAQQIFNRKVNDNLMDVIFVKPIESAITPEEEMLKIMDNHRIKVQSVVLPIQHQLYSLKTEEQVLNWLQNKIHSQYSAFYKINTKYNEDVERVSWNNNKMQNQRFSELKILYKDSEE
jgi:hypothetical protein